MRRLWLMILILVLAAPAIAQEAAEDYLFYKLEGDDVAEFSIATDTLLFYRAIQHREDMYGDIADYRL